MMEEQLLQPLVDGGLIAEMPRGFIYRGKARSSFIGVKYMLSNISIDPLRPATPADW